MLNKNITKAMKTNDNKNDNNWPANHIARFTSRAGQFLWWNRAVHNYVQKNMYQKNLYKI